MTHTFATVKDTARFLRDQLRSKRFALLYAHNGTGKTRLSTEFKKLGKENGQKDTLYFNAFTEDLFTWENDLHGDAKRELKLNTSSKFFDGLAELEMDTRIKRFLAPYCDYDFRITEDTVSFSRTRQRTNDEETAEDLIVSDIKISRGEEQLFKWCFFLAILQAVLDGSEAYDWVQYVYIDDPVSSLDEHNAIAIANRLVSMIRKDGATLPMVVSTHHALFFNVLSNELPSRQTLQFVLSRNRSETSYKLTAERDDTPFFHHVSLMKELHQAVQDDTLYTYHFNFLRSIMEKTASFHGHKSFKACVKQRDDDEEGVLHARMLNILSHGNYSLYEPRLMNDDNKEQFRRIFEEFRTTYLFNPELFPEETTIA